MKDYICSVLRDAERTIEKCCAFFVECRDGCFFEDLPVWIDAVRSHQAICGIYYKHWPSEFDKRMLKRFNRIMRFDWRFVYRRWLPYEK